ncbi:MULTISPECIES: hypothetical protein [Bacillus cereus group]|uniref:hypothetical protein n=1 Tax=Bacillus cereus group TaxID=86661 RepID=UPI000BED8D95|nr:MULTISPECIES: hypothetical protein [Bacillus cereus group]PEE11088.1 hypothetical protein CON52_16480 [Bacillus cereus]PFP08514.1 hypothetical protein COJ91_09565 [Bacillus thuringiensis]PGP55924.1 hypothetical protein CN992_04400 [Bacillus thuringiensis]PGU35160.1 hypothetical protein COD63_29810 [Bacillus thuringiensis]PGV86859.1 hypothetical protein COD85_10460 [Bacillus thuringiensis]
MIDIITSFFLLVIYSIRYLFSTGENRKKAKADLKEFWTDTDGQILLGAGMGLAVIILGYLFMTQINF